MNIYLRQGFVPPAMSYNLSYVEVIAFCTFNISKLHSRRINLFHIYANANTKRSEISINKYTEKEIQ